MSMVKEKELLAWQILGVEARMSTISHLSASISLCGLFLLSIVQVFAVGELDATSFHLTVVLY